MRLKCLPFFLGCVLLLAAGCGNVGVSGQGSNRGGSSGSRSEEHTSELQSQR